MIDLLENLIESDLSQEYKELSLELLSDCNYAQYGENIKKNLENYSKSIPMIASVSNQRSALNKQLKQLKKSKTFTEKDKQKLNTVKNKLASLEGNPFTKKRNELLKKMEGENQRDCPHNELNELLEEEKKYLHFLKDKAKLEERIDSVKDKKSKVLANNHLSSGMNILNTLLSTKDPELIVHCLEQVVISSDQKFPLLSHNGIIDELFQLVFGFTDDEISDISSKLESLRDPSALILFYNRLKELKTRRKDSLYVYKNMVLATLKGEFMENLHDITNNSTLRTIFEKRETLQENWTNVDKVFKVSDLVNQPDETCQDYEIKIATDPTDILNLGIDMRHCLHLTGRLERVLGLGAFTVDGKIHIIIVKDSDGKIVGETRLLLMWNEKKQEPILYLDEIEYNEMPNQKYSIREALRIFCYNESDRLGLDIVSIYGKNNVRRTDVGAKYSDSIKSLGGPAPTEYVNYYWDNRDDGNFKLRETYILYETSGIGSALKQATSD